MGNISIKNGTPTHGQSLCKTCTHGHWQKGFRESDEIVFCYWGPLRRVPFPVAECSNFSDGTQKFDMEQMMEIATILGQSRRVAGFAKQEDEDGDRENVIAIR
jgi:hypothetical protein